jgi:hypothetical protein
MTIRSLIHSLPASRAILRAASLLVPRPERAEWIAEWRAELWHVWRSYAADSPRHPRGTAKVTAFCFGAFQDALWLRRNTPRSLSHRLLRFGSPSRCGVSLAILAMASMLICLVVPGARKAMYPSPYRSADELVMISYGGASAEHLPTIRLGDYQSWKSSTRHLFTDLAFYQLARKRIHVARHLTAELSVARASDNLFEVLNLSSLDKGKQRMGHRSGPGLILNEEAWRRYFHGDSQIVGRTLEIAGQEVRVVGVIPGDSWQLPGQVDAWMLEDEQHLNELPSGSRGFLLAHVKKSGFPADSRGRRYMNVYREGEEIDRYDCISLTQRAHEPFSIFLFTLLLACLALPATTPLPLGEYPRERNHPPSGTRCRRWFFLAAKLSLIFPVVYFSSLDLAYAGLPVDSPAAQYTQLVTSFFGFLFALRWALQDQRRRCPVCLRLLTNPARVGQASQNFLAWNGTELICSVGHGLLHIPELPTSWFSTQRWLYLDPSWNSLFSDTYLASAGTS